MKSTLAAVAFLLIQGAAIRAADAPSAPQPEAVTQPEPAPADKPLSTLVTNIQDPQITECSGIAASQRYPGFFWVNNDSGDSARVFLLNAQGQNVATIKLKGAYARDWEDIDIAAGMVYVGDIGDNMAWRDGLQIYRFTEPELDTQKLGQQIELEPQKFTIRYPGKARDAETLLTAPDGRIWILSKEASGSSLLGATFKNNDTQEMNWVGEKINFGATGIFTKLATGGNFSPDGTKLVVTTYAQIYEWQLAAPYEVERLAAITPIIKPLPSLKQCESVCYSADGSQIFVSTEGKNSPIYAFTSAY